MADGFDRRQFVLTGAAAGLGALAVRRGAGGAPAVQTRRTRPVVLSDLSGIQFKNGGPMSAVEKTFSEITQGSDVLDAILAGVEIAELDPAETGIGYGGLPNGDGTVELDACCMHGPKKRAGGVAALQGVRTPSRVAKAVMDYTDHHLLVGSGAQHFARQMGFEIESDLNTEKSRASWLEWKRRTDPLHYLDPEQRAQIGHEVALQMVREGLISEASYWGTISCVAITPSGDHAGCTSTSGLSFKIPGRVGDSPILGSGIYVDNEVGAVGSTGRGEANLYNLTPFLIVENLRRGMHPKDAGLAGLERIRTNTVEQRLLNSHGDPAFNIRFFVLNARGEYAGVALYAKGESHYAVCTENGAERLELETLLEGDPDA